jgi:adenylate cyclase
LAFKPTLATELRLETTELQPVVLQLRFLRPWYHATSQKAPVILATGGTSPVNSRTPSSSAHAFEREFALEVLSSDKLRVTILIGVITSAILVVLILAAFSTDQFTRAFHGDLKGFLTNLLVVGGSALLFLLIERALITRMINEQKGVSEFFQYLSAFIETSLPTAGMIVGSIFLGPIYTLFTPSAFIYPIFIVLSALRLNFKLCVFTGMVAGLEYIVLAMVLINRTSTAGIEPILFGSFHHFFKGFLLFATGVVTGLVTREIRKRILKSFEMVEERNRISRTFGEYVSPEVMQKLLTLKPDLMSEKRTVCVMFLDIRDFTSFAEKRTPEEVVAYLESLFGFMIEIVNRHHGVINKFLGDGFMAVFGAPVSHGSDCVDAVTAAKEILSRIQAEVTQGNVLPTTVGIGLHAGEAVTGSIGSSLRKEYTVIGDVVNLAARIEKLNKDFGSQLLVSEMVWQTLGDYDITGVPMGQVQVRGREKAIQLYQVH